MSQKKAKTNIPLTYNKEACHQEYIYFRYSPMCFMGFSSGLWEGSKYCDAKIVLKNFQRHPYSIYMMLLQKIADQQSPFTKKKTENHIDGEPFCFSQSILLRSSQHIRGNLFYFDVCSWKWMLCYREEETVWDCCVKGNNSAKLRLLYMNIFKALFVHNEKCFSSVR